MSLLAGVGRAGSESGGRGVGWEDGEWVGRAGRGALGVRRQNIEKVCRQEPTCGEGQPSQI